MPGMTEELIVAVKHFSAASTILACASLSLSTVMHRSCNYHTPKMDARNDQTYLGAKLAARD